MNLNILLNFRIFLAFFHLRSLSIIRQRGILLLLSKSANPVFRQNMRGQRAYGRAEAEFRTVGACIFGCVGSCDFLLPGFCGISGSGQALCMVPQSFNRFSGDR